MGATITLPSGSWKNSCTDYSFNNQSGLLTAYLKDKHGTPQKSSVIVTNGMTLENDDGKFVISSTGWYTDMDTLSNTEPSGDWKTTARSISLKNCILSALLQCCDGSWTHSTIVVVQNMTLENNDGCFNITTECRNSGRVVAIDRPQVPLGSWVQSARRCKITKQGSILMLRAELQNERGQWVSATHKYIDGTIPILGNNNGSFSVDNRDCASLFD